MTPTRGERNFNPGNIERNTTHWQGMCLNQSGDPRFVVFIDAVAGIRALAKLILTYSRTHGLNTVREIIDRWAPPNENDTDSYAQHVADLLGKPLDEVIDVEDAATLEVLVRAIIQHENGRCVYSAATVLDGVNRALA